MSINFLTTYEKLISSVICKNSDEFLKIEGQLSKNHPKLITKGIKFFFNGKKINRYKSLEQNGIKNNDIIIIKKIDD